jgi:hypothetical protein
MRTVSGYLRISCNETFKWNGKDRPRDWPSKTNLVQCEFYAGKRFIH